MVEVMQEDREAAASIAVLVEMRELIREGRADHHAEPFARHRIAAENAARGDQVAEVERLREALLWYERQASDYRKITTEGEDARYALERDGGTLARAALKDTRHDADA